MIKGEMYTSEDSDWGKLVYIFDRCTPAGNIYGFETYRIVLQPTAVSYDAYWKVGDLLLFNKSTTKRWIHRKPTDEEIAQMNACILSGKFVPLKT